MKSLFLRLLVSMWGTMVVILGLFAVIYAVAIPKDLNEGPRPFLVRMLTLRAEAALRCPAGAGGSCAEVLEPVDSRDDRVSVYRGEELVLGRPIAGAAAIQAEARSKPGGAALRSDDVDLTAVVLPSDPSLAAVAVGPVRSPWHFIIGLDTLPYRLGVIILVTGAVSFALARWLTRPLGVLRGATRKMADGDLTVRVSPELGDADGETIALGRDMDAMAERINDLVESHRRLLRDVSHELRSPLARLAISLELVRRKAPADVSPALDRIERETERLNAMIGELLVLSRLESAGAIESGEPVDLAGLVEPIAEDANLEGEDKGIRVEVHATPCRVRGDAEMLRRAVENVVRNAVRYSEPGATVDVRVTAVDGVAQIRVRDRGPGVPAESLDRIFEPFYRVETDRARSQGGTGIGLAITQRAVRLHGGTVEARNADGGGLELLLTLPLAS
ncbi:MAG: HAMP domain-containing protein [Myxococcales bacterium]|nr:HAMP domain-containing protein [Myxococcales bacterium]